MRGAGHALVRLLRRVQTAHEQPAWIAAVQAGGAIFALGGFHIALPLVIAAAAVRLAVGAARDHVCREPRPLGMQPSLAAADGTQTLKL